jgi:integrase
VVERCLPFPRPRSRQLRARLGPADALMVSVLAYAGLRPQELLALQWNDIHERAILVRRKNVDGQLYPYSKTRQNRRVKLLAPLATDLAEWKLASGRRDGLVVPRTDGQPGRDHDYRNWRRRVYKPHAAAVGLTSGVPYDLRGSFASLLAWEGQTMLEVARQAGHSVAICERHYAGIFEDYDPAQRTSAEAAIRAVREPGVRGVCALADAGAEGEMQNAWKPCEADARTRTGDPFITSICRSVTRQSRSGYERHLLPCSCGGFGGRRVPGRCLPCAA